MNNCGCCCNKVLDFCNQDICGSIDFDIKAQVPGTHKMVTEFLGVKINVEKEFSVDDNIEFPLEGFNERFQYTVELYDPLGTKILIRKNDVDYDCFRFITTIGVTKSYVAVS